MLFLCGIAVLIKHGVHKEASHGEPLPFCYRLQLFILPWVTGHRKRLEKGEATGRNSSAFLLFFHFQPLFTSNTISVAMLRSVLSQL